MLFGSKVNVANLSKSLQSTISDISRRVRLKELSIESFICSSVRSFCVVSLIISGLSPLLKYGNFSCMCIILLGYTFVIVCT